MENSTKKILQKFSSNKVDLSLQQAEKIIQGIGAYKRYGDKFESDIQELKMQLLEIDRELDQGIDEMEQDERNLDKALDEIKQMKKTIGQDIPQAVAGIERREKEIQDAMDKLSDYQSMWRIIGQDIQGLK